MRAVVLPEYQGNIVRALRSLQLKELDMPVLQPDELLVSIAAAPCNPSDLAFIQGGYNVRKSLPAIPGFEGTGTVVDAGSAALLHQYKGKNVSFFSQSDRGGSWASHIPVKATDCLLLRDGMPPEQAACFAVNPFTAFAMVELATQQGAKAIVQNAAGGQVAQFITKLASLQGLKVINIVRKEEQWKRMKDEGDNHVLWQLEVDFDNQLHALAGDLQAGLAFDAVGGELSGQILSALPEGGTLYLYGALGARTLSGIPAGDVIFRRKSVRGFNMNEWKESLTKDGFENISSRLQEHFITGTLQTNIQTSFKLSEFNDALMHYIRNMSGGKVLMMP